MTLMALLVIPPIANLPRSTSLSFAPAAFQPLLHVDVPTNQVMQPGAKTSALVDNAVGLTDCVIVQDFLTAAKASFSISMHTPRPPFSVMAPRV
ncbi:hypothetical protein GGI42DRAFT_337362 [Trichoderma sp. SZMC 28013]